MLCSIGLLAQPYYYFAPHVHDHWEICYYVRGMGVVTIGDERFQFAESDVIIQPPHIPHSEESQQGYENIHFVLDELPQSLCHVRQLRDTSTNDLRALLMMVYRSYFWQASPNEALIGSLMEVIYQYMQILSSGGVRNKYVEQMKAIIISNMSNREFSLSNMYREIHLNEDHARRLFQAEMHVSPLTYLSQLRVRRACSLLGTADDRITVRQVGELVGIDDPYYFSRLFKQYTGQSPRHWVKQQRGQ